MGIDGVPTDSIGLVLSLYFAGMFVGAIYSKTLIARAGHIRMFAGCISLSSISILFCSFSTDLILWGCLRAVFGFCNACAFTAMESWLSDSSTKETRGKILGVYNTMIWGGLFGGQFFISLGDPADTTLFVMAGILLCAAVIPVSLSRNQGPKIIKVKPTSLFTLYRLSPLGVVSCLASGFLFAALFNLLPIFAKGQNIDGFQLSLYMGGAIVGGFILQFPIGYLSDKFDRRVVLLTLLIISSIAAFTIPLFSIQENFWITLVVTSLLGGIVACTYPLSISQVFDQLEQNQMVAAMGSLILGFSLGGAIGPYSTSLVMSMFGNDSLFYFLMVLQLCLAAFVARRMSIRDALPVEEQESFVMQATVSTPTAKLDPRILYVDLASKE